MVNLRQSISTFRKKGKDAVPSPTQNKFRKSAGSPTAGATKRMSTLGVFKSKTEENNDDLSAHIGEIKMSAQPFKSPSPAKKQFSSLQGFPVEEKEEDEEPDLARKTDLKLQERREQRRKRQEELQKQLQQKLQTATDNNNPSLEGDSDFPGALPLHMAGSEETPVRQRAAGGRKSAIVRSRRAGESERPNRESRASAVQPRQSSPGRRMPRRPKQLDATEQQSNGIRPFPPLQIDISGESGTIPELDEDEKLPGRTQRERRKGRKKEDGDGSQEFEVSPLTVGDRKRPDGQHVGLQNGQRRERRKTETALGQRKPVRPIKETGEASKSSPGALSNSHRSSVWKQADGVGRQRQSMRPREMPNLSPPPSDLDNSHRSTGRATAGIDTSMRSTGFDTSNRSGSHGSADRVAGLDTSLRSAGRATGLDTSHRSAERALERANGLDTGHRSAGRKSKFNQVDVPRTKGSWDEVIDARKSKSNQADVARTKGSWDEGNDHRGLSSQSEHRAATRRKRREKIEEQNHASLLHKSEHGHTGARVAKRKTLGAGAARRKRDELTSSPQSDTRRRRRESETMRTNRSLDDGLGFVNLGESAKHRREKSNGVRFTDDVKNKTQRNTLEMSRGDVGKSPRTPGGKSKAKFDGEKMLSPRASAKKRISPRPSPRNSSRKRNSTKSPKGENPKGSTLPSVFDDEYGYPLEDASESQNDFDYQEASRNRRPDIEHGEEWIQPIPTFDAKGLQALKETVDQIGSADVPQGVGDAVGDVAKAKSPKKPKKPKKPNQDGLVDENSSSSSSEFSSSAESEVIPTEVPVVNQDYSKRVSALNPDGYSSDEYTSASDSDDSSESSASSESSTESAVAGEIPAIVSTEGSMDDLDDISSASNSGSENGGKQGHPERPIAGALDEQILPRSLRENRTFNPNDEAPQSKQNAVANVKEANNGNAEDIPPPPSPSHPPPPSPVPAKDNKPKHNDQMPERVSEGNFDDVFSNEITALEGTLQDMGDLLQTPAKPEDIRKKAPESPDVPPSKHLGNGLAPNEDLPSKVEISTPLPPVAPDQNEKAPFTSLESQTKPNDHLQPQPSDYQFLMDIMGLIAPPSLEQKTMMESNPAMGKDIMVAAAKQENLNRQRLIQKVGLLESKLSTLQNDLEKQQLETAAHKMQVLTQDLTISEYKASMETLTQKCQILEKETEAISSKYLEQEKKESQMKDSLEETKQLLKEQQLFMNAQQRQMQTMETKIATLQVTRDREESKMSMENVKLREIIFIQKEKILNVLGNHGEPKT